MVGLSSRLEIRESSLGQLGGRTDFPHLSQVWQKVTSPVVVYNQPFHPHYRLLPLNHSPENPGCGSLFGEVESSIDSPEVRMSDAARTESTIC